MSVDPSGRSNEEIAKELLKPFEELLAKEDEELKKEDELIQEAERKEKQVFHPEA
jgi:hypothetical protein